MGLVVVIYPFIIIGFMVLVNVPAGISCTENLSMGNRKDIINETNKNSLFHA
jgi:hypothetical protein